MEEEEPIIVSNIIEGESISASLRILNPKDGKAPTIEYKVKVTASLSKVGDVGQLIAKTIDEIHTECNERGIVV